MNLSRTALVTGAAGIIGPSICRELMDRVGWMPVTKYRQIQGYDPVKDLTNIVIKVEV